MGEAMVVVSGKGGTGKTSFVAGVGSALAVLGYEVLCMDCDAGLRNLDLALGLSDRAFMDYTDVALGRCSLEEAAALVKGAGLPLYGAALGEHTLDVRRADLRAAAVVVGSEGRGLSPAALTLCDGTVRIPMSPRCESLNAGAAAAVLLWEMARDSLEG